VLGGARYLLFDVGGLVAIAGLVLTFLISAIANTRRLYKAEPLPRKEPKPFGRGIIAA
jgi:hypothetical protein